MPSTCFGLYKVIIREVLLEGIEIHQITSRMCMYSLVYNLPDDGLLEVETCGRDIIDNK
jgi:hypothetical protein